MAAEKQREKLLGYLDSWWTTLEGGIPEPEMELDANVTLGRGKKRKRKPSKKQKMREGVLMDEKMAASETVDEILCTVISTVGVHHDCGHSSLAMLPEGGKFEMEGGDRQPQQTN